MKMARFSTIFRPDRLQVLAEVAAVFSVFALYAAWPVPDSNEAHYLGKMIHFWNPAWGDNDFFLNSDDPHFVFFVGFGWLSRWLTPVALAWVGRLATWWLLAWAWRRLNWAVLDRRWWSVATAAIFLLLMDHFAMAGEWVVGGLEAKGFAYVLVFLGLEALVRGAWNRVWLCFGGAGTLHVLVGGWAAVAAGLAWIFLGKKNRPTLRSMWWGLAGGLALAILNLIASLRLTWGVDPRLVEAAHQIHVFVRLAHHLYPAGFAVLPFAVMLFVWLAVRWQTPSTHPVWRLHAMVAGSILITMAGFAIAYATARDPSLSASLLRFYWFRLSDVMVPLGVAVGAPVVIEQLGAQRAAFRRVATIAVVLLAAWQIGPNAWEQIAGRSVRNLQEPERSHFAAWRDACRWIAASGRIPPDARFLTPRLCRTFKWYTGRAEVINWKDIPQDPASIVEWWRRMQIVHATGSSDPSDRWFESLAELGEGRLIALGRHYRAGYVLTESIPRLALPIEYENAAFTLYRLPSPESPNPQSTGP